MPFYNVKPLGAYAVHSGAGYGQILTEEGRRYSERERERLDSEIKNILKNSTSSTNRTVDVQRSALDDMLANKDKSAISDLYDKINRSDAMRNAISLQSGRSGSNVNPLLASRNISESYNRSGLPNVAVESAIRRGDELLRNESDYINKLISYQNRQKQIDDKYNQMRRASEIGFEQMGEGLAKAVIQNDVRNTIAERKMKYMMDESEREIFSSMLNSMGTFMGAAAGGMGGMGGGGGGEIPSDRNTKKHVKDGKGSIDIILETVGPVEYEYKDEYKDNSNAGRGKHLGVMAQDMEKAGLDGIVMVDPLTGMKVIDTVKMIPLLLAAQSRLNEKIDEKQDKKGNKGSNKK